MHYYNLMHYKKEVGEEDLEMPCNEARAMYIIIANLNPEMHEIMCTLVC